MQSNALKRAIELNEKEIRVLRSQGTVEFSDLDEPTAVKPAAKVAAARDAYASIIQRGGTPEEAWQLMMM